MRFPTEKSIPGRELGDPLGVIREIQTRWPELTVQFLNPDAMIDPGDPPYRIVERCRDGVERQVLQIWELDNRVIERLKIMDVFSGFDPELELAKLNAKAKADAEEKEAAERRELAEIAGAVVASEQSSFSFKDHKTDKLITIKKDEGPRY